MKMVLEFRQNPTCYCSTPLKEVVYIFGQTARPFGRPGDAFIYASVHISDSFLWQALVDLLPLAG